VRGTRGGQAPNKLQGKTLDIPCLVPFNQLIIRPDGKLSLCCQDALGKYTLGDVSKQTLLEAWHSEVYHTIREQLIESRENVALCRYCDKFSPDVFDIHHGKLPY
jgi:radical SAM protein with 4Fe4S-binding SPASM domain